MKKILCIILAAVTLICSAACTENGALETDTGITQQTELQTEAETEDDNAASKRVLEKCGFIANGIIGKEGPRYALTRRE